MSTLSYIEREKLSALFEIRNGYIFISNNFNKNKTREMILEATNIDIYNDFNYVNLSQEKCIRKIWDICDDYTVSKLLNKMLEYYNFYCKGYIDENEMYLYNEAKEIIVRLEKEKITLPQINIELLKIIKEDIEKNILDNKPELSIDRLHTFATKYIRNIYEKHNIKSLNEQGDYYPLHSLVGKLKNWYKDNNYFESSFAVVAIQNTINVFDKFNEIRNEHSAAHTNTLLNKEEATYAVNIISDTLMFIDNIEHIKDVESNNTYSEIGLIEEPPIY